VHGSPRSFHCLLLDECCVGRWDRYFLLDDLETRSLSFDKVHDNLFFYVFISFFLSTAEAFSVRSPLFG